MLKVTGVDPQNREDFILKNLIRFDKPLDTYYLRHEENRVLRIPTILENDKKYIDKRTRHKRVRIRITIEEVE